MSINQYTEKKLLANIITINKKLLDMTLGLAEAFKGNTVGFIIGEVDSDVTELTNRVKQPVQVVEVNDDVAKLRAQVDRLMRDCDYFRVLAKSLNSECNTLCTELEVERDRADENVADCQRLDAQLAEVTAQRDALQSQVDDLSDNGNPRRNEKVRNQRRELDALGKAYRIVCKELDELGDEYRGVCAERDALQARINAGVRVYGYQGSWYNTKWTADTDTALLIDPQPIAQAWTRADGSTNPRTGERREKGSWEYCSCHRLLKPSCHKNMDYCWRPTSGDGTFAQDNRRDPSGANDRRMKP